MSHSAAFHLGLHGLPKYQIRGLWYTCTFRVKTLDSLRAKNIFKKNHSLFSNRPINMFHTQKIFLPSHIQRDISLPLSIQSLIADPEVVGSIPAQPHSFMEIDHEIFSTVIFLLWLIQEHLLLGKSESMHMSTG